MDLLKRAISIRNTYAATLLSSSCTAWFPDGVEEVQVSCISGEINRADKSRQMAGFLRQPVDDIVIRVKLLDLPNGKPTPASRFFAGSTTTRADAVRYEVESVKSMSHLDDHIEIKGSRTS